jgi:hypothetical protein
VYSKQLLFECKICVLAGADLANLFTETPNLFASETLDRDCFMDSPLTDAVKSAIVTLASSDRLFLVLSIVFLISLDQHQPEHKFCIQIKVVSSTQSVKLEVMLLPKT